MLLGDFSMLITTHKVIARNFVEAFRQKIKLWKISSIDPKKVLYLVQCLLISALHLVMKPNHLTSSIKNLKTKFPGIESLYRYPVKVFLPDLFP